MLYYVFTAYVLRAFLTYQPAFQTSSYTLDDLDELAVILSNPEVMKYSPREPIAKEKARTVTYEVLEFFINHWQQHSFGVWDVVEKVTRKLLGHCGLNFLPNSPEVEVLYRLEQTYWNQGIATKATKASLRYGFESVKLEHIVAITVPEHKASQRLMEKAGLKYEKNAHFYNLDVAYYAISRQQWRPDDSPYIMLG